MSYSKYVITINGGVETVRIQPFIQIVESGIVFAYDEFKFNWLSINGYEVLFQHNYKNAKPILYLRYDNFPSNINGFIFQDKATLSEIVCTTKEINTGIIKVQVKRVGVVIYEYEMTFTSESNKRVYLNENVEQDDVLSAFVSSGSFDYPSLKVKYNIRL